jgi:hypothetical protein
MYFVVLLSGLHGPIIAKLKDAFAPIQEPNLAEFEICPGCPTNVNSERACPGLELWLHNGA